jgi:hypothetical protein
VFYAQLFIIIIQLFILFFIFKLFKKMALSERVPTFPEGENNDALVAEIDALKAKDLAVDGVIANIKADAAADDAYDVTQDAHIKNLEDHLGAVPAVEEVVEEAPVVEEPTVGAEG